MTSSAEGLRVAIVGGSIGGLSCAMELSAIGCDVHVFERSPRPLEGRGAGIVLHPVTTASLERQPGFDLDRMSSMTEVLRYLDRGGVVVHEQGVSYRFTSYAALYGALVDAVDPTRYHLGHELLSLDTGTAGAVVATFLEGEAAEAELVVGADGIRSTVRAVVDPAAAPRRAGYVAWRGTVPDLDLPDGATSLRKALTYHVGRQTHMLTYEIPTPGRSSARSMNWVWYRNVDDQGLADLLIGRDGSASELSLAPGQVRQPFLDELVDAAAVLPPAMGELVRATDEPFVQVIADLEPRGFVFGSVCLLGDAACALRPHIAVGTAKAVDDGRALAEALSGGGSLAEVLARWEPGRLELARATTARTRAVGERAQTTGTFVPGDPSVAFGLQEPFDGAYPA